jgi:leucyl-tRNA synthetase
MSEIPTPVNRARALRRNLTPAEQKLWERLRNRKFHGLKFLRQHPFIYQVDANRPYFFIADFYCAEKRLIIEVDGNIHEFQKEEDKHREEILESLNLNIMRIKNEETETMPDVLNRITDFIKMIEMKE